MAPSSFSNSPLLFDFFYYQKKEELLSFLEKGFFMQGTSSSSSHLSADQALLVSAIQKKEISTLRSLLLESRVVGQLINCRDVKGATPIHYSVKASFIEGLSFLIESGGEINALDNKGRTPLQLALKREEREIAYFTLFGERRAFQRELISSSSEKSRARQLDERLSEAFQSGAFLEQIALLVERGFLFSQEKNYFHAALVLNSGYALTKKSSTALKAASPLIHEIGAVEKRLAYHLFGIEQSGDISSSIAYYRSELQRIREEAAQGLETRACSFSISYHITQGYLHLLRSILFESIAISKQEPPTSFAMVGLGSVARGEAAPYSDLEFIFLIQDGSEANRTYFRSIAKLMMLKIINLGETEFKLVRTQNKEGIFFEESILPKGFSADIGGLSPLGKEGLYELIATPHELAQFQTEEWFVDHDSEAILINALATPLLIAGDSSLLDAYEKGLAQILDTSLPTVSRSIRQVRALDLIRGAIDEFKPRLDRDKIDLRAFDIKKEFYRLPQMVLQSLALYYDIKSRDTLGRIDQLKEQGVFNGLGAERLGSTLEAIVRLRIRAHLFYRTEKEILYVPWATFDPSQTELLVITPELNHLVVDIYRTIIPLFEAAKRFVDGDEKAFLLSNLYDEGVGKVLGSEVASLSTIGSSLKTAALNPRDPSAFTELGRLELEMKRAPEAIESFSQALFVAALQEEESSSLGVHLHNLGVAYTKSDPATSTEYLASALSIEEEQAGDGPTASKALTLRSLGESHYKLGQYEEAVSFHQQALEMLKAVFQDQPESEVAMTLNSLGNSYRALEMYEEAFKNYIASLLILREVYGHEPHADIFMVFYNAGSLMQLLGEEEEAMKYLSAGAEVGKQLYEGRSHPLMADMLSRLGLSYYKMERYEKAVELNQAALEMRLAIHGDEAHKETAASYDSLGNSYDELGAVDEAIAAHGKALTLRREVYREAPNKKVAISLNNLGSAYNRKGRHEEAIACFEEAYAIFAQTVGLDHQNTKMAQENLESARSNKSSCAIL